MAIDFVSQSTSAQSMALPRGLHVAIIMDGNGRWASARGLPRTEGHRVGVRSVRAVVEAAPDLGITMLTLYAFSSDNWRRPREEVAVLMQLLKAYLAKETRTCMEQGVRIQMIGKRNRLSPALLAAIEKAEADTAGGGTLALRIAVDYSSRDAITAAFQREHSKTAIDADAFAVRVREDEPPRNAGRNVDLLIRTGGEQRLSDFMLWECAYAELYFTPAMWPEFGGAALGEAVRAFHGRQRRFGGVPAPSALSPAPQAVEH